MQSIIIAFTLKGQNFKQIAAILNLMADDFHPAETILIHGFLPRRILMEKSIPTDVVDTLEKYFPCQLNLFYDGPLRKEMAEVGKSLQAAVYVIGEPAEGVAEEVALYKAAGLGIVYLSLDPEKYKPI